MKSLDTIPQGKNSSNFIFSIKIRSEKHKSVIK